MINRVDDICQSLQMPLWTNYIYQHNLSLKWCPVSFIQSQITSISIVCVYFCGKKSCINADHGMEAAKQFPDLVRYYYFATLKRYSSHVILCSYTLSREYRVVRYRYSRLLFTSEDRLCANLRVQEQSTHMTSQCQCPTFAWRHRQTVVTSQ